MKKWLFACFALLLGSTMIVAANNGPPGDFQNFVIEESPQGAAVQVEAYAFVMPERLELATLETGMIETLAEPAGIETTVEIVTNIGLPPARAVHLDRQACTDKTLTQRILYPVACLPPPFS